MCVWGACVCVGDLYVPGLCVCGGCVCWVVCAGLCVCGGGARASVAIHEVVV